MRKRTVAVVVALAVGATSLYHMLRKHTLSQKPSEILALAKTYFTKEAPISGGWISHHPVLSLRNNSEVLVYYGGISREEHGKLVSYEFVAAADSGEILEFYPLPI